MNFLIHTNCLAVKVINSYLKGLDLSLTKKYVSLVASEGHSVKIIKKNPILHVSPQTVVYKASVFVHIICLFMVFNSVFC